MSICEFSKAYIDKEEVNLIGDSSDQLTATIEPDNTTDQSLSWSSSDTSVVTIDENGKITAVGKGEATITVTTSNGKTVTCQVSVSNPATQFTLIPTELNVVRGNTIEAKLAATG